jgi:hypothetical protein
MFFDQLFNAGQFGAGKSMVGGQRNRTQPELRFHFLASDVNVRRFVVFAAVKMKAIRPNAHHGWHEMMLTDASEIGNRNTVYFPI